MLSQSNIFTCNRSPNSGSPTLRIFTVYMEEEKKEKNDLYIYIYVYSLIQININLIAKEIISN